jgi:predicted  nucleic acid-binding Zn-ribbon protein
VGSWDVYIKKSELETLAAQLGSIIEEFEKAESRADSLEDAIGDPFGRNELREKAEDFEDRWNDKRDDLKESLKKVKEHVEGVLEGIADWDSEAAYKLEAHEPSAPGQPANSRGGMTV